MVIKCDLILVFIIPLQMQCYFLRLHLFVFPIKLSSSHHSNMKYAAGLVKTTHRAFYLFFRLLV